MPKPTPSTAYEQVVKKLLTTRLVGGGLVDLKAFHLKKYLGKSGQEHQIDVSYETVIADLSIIILVECKHFTTRKVGVEDIMTFAYRLRDTGAHKGIIVTTQGFQEGVAKVAKAEGIALLIAARGRLSMYMGARLTLFTLWIHAIGVRVSESTGKPSVCGIRREEGNVFASLEPLSDESPVSHERDDIAFLLPSEESLVSNEEDTEPFLRRRLWEDVHVIEEL